ncbi:XdhC family aldehyde oxidoreductase maturation factor [Desulfobacula sp.]|uniref:XdhC family aldehyde oxidoreductase maturation factor n=1 Tax=Desulfobacula sp. TaxID=2593537 RepID=UPI002611671D|nr:XdhC family protein [Desulfobacula sp.]
MLKNSEVLYDSLKQGKAVVMATILSKQGSAPRSAGTKMIVHAEGDISGTIGGGWVEAQVQKQATDLFERKEGALIREFTLDSNRYADMDMVCGGNVTLLIEYLPANNDNIKVFSKLLEILSNNQNGFMVSRLQRDKRGNYTLERSIISDRQQTGVFPLGEQTVGQLSKQAELMRSPGLITIDDGTFFVEPARFNGVLYLLGAGHLAVETAKLALHTGFKTVVMDDRGTFANEERFPGSRVHVVEGFEHCFAPFSIGHGSYIVIMTRGHLYDQILLEQALHTPATYIGMIGSRSKRKIIYDYLLSQGVSQEQLDRVHAPIGLSIGAQTPEEIAVSIVAELIQVRFQTI